MPAAPGICSAMGLLTTDLKYDTVRTVFARSDRLDPAELADDFSGMQADLEAQVLADGIAIEDAMFSRAADVRYRRQAYELTVPLADGAITPASLDTLATAFHDKHYQTYGHANPSERVQLVNVRVTAIGRLPPLTRIANPPMAGLAPATQVFDGVPADEGVGARDEPGHGARAQKVRDVWFLETGFVACPVYWREDLIATETFTGPAIIEAMDSTIVMPPGWIAAVDARGYIRLHRR